MREREVGGYEPDDVEQLELVELWHLSRTALAGTSYTRSTRITWLVDEFIKKHQGEPYVARKWIYVWAERNLGHLTAPDARTVTIKDNWGHSHVVGGFGDVGTSKGSK